VRFPAGSRRTLALLLVAVVIVSACAAEALPTASPTQGPVETAPPTDSPAPIDTPSGSPGPTATISPPPPTPVPPASWRELEPAGGSPRAREDQTWTVDPSIGIAYLFGGRDGTRILGDLWAFDLAADRWARLSPAGATPDARFGHEAVWVDGIGLVIFAGQAGPTTFFSDLWAYDPGTDRWSRLPEGGARPVARYGTCAAVGPDGRLWISHGFTEDGTRFADTRAYDFGAGRWSDETPTGPLPVARCLHGCWWTDDGRFALYAGQTTGVPALGDLWSLGGAGSTGATWIAADGQFPADRNLYAFARRGEDIVVFGGGRARGRYLDDLFVFDATRFAVRAAEIDGPAPTGRAGSTLIDDPVRGRLLLFGGKSGRGALADLWELTLP
jgi:hypothetical protein